VPQCAGFHQPHSAAFPEKPISFKKIQTNALAPAGFVSVKSQILKVWLFAFQA
jgi:hypothetical protein